MSLEVGIVSVTKRMVFQLTATINGTVWPGAMVRVYTVGTARLPRAIVFAITNVQADGASQKQ